MRKLNHLSLASILLLPSLVSAQTVVEDTTSLSGVFFTSVITGVVVAVGIQFLLSNLAIASGISAIGDISDNSDNSSSSKNSSSSHNTKKTGRKVSSAFGIFTMVTMSISVFVATLLAIEISVAESLLNGMILGVVIWSLFFISALILDAKLTSSILGNMIGYLRKGAAAITGATVNSFSQSDEAKAKAFAKETVKAVHDEVREEFNTSDIDKKIKQYIDRTTQSQFSAKDLRKELETLINEIEVEEQYSTDDSGVAKKLILDIANQRPSLNDEQKQQLSQTYDEVKNTLKKEGSNKQKATALFDKLSPGDEEKGKQYRQQLLTYLNDSDQEAVTPETLEKDLNDIFDNPKGAYRILSNRAANLDRESLKGLLQHHDNMDEQKADRVLKAYDSAISFMQSKTSSNENTYEEQASNLPAKRSKVEQRIQAWFDRLDRPELQYRNLKADFMEMLDNPSHTPDVVLNRVKKMDENSIRALLTNNQAISEQDIDNYIAKYNDARNDLLKRYEDVKAETAKRISALKQAALDEAEGVRATAASVAWWLFASALVSLSSAAIAGAVATNLI
ncbi:hypothetical protein [Alteromonas sp. PRIM-21]|uniref:hypothetical protein n=1 Tax=Alteromonas sp. PRIM-21 TaxID=1454978 RepID=UPI0022B94B66|nr:hypothetical protein [Alteromonas sp. PRIM-21]MCZ8530733.1 hypothetical protein [Alteromonas sp. PRIM-21]